MKNLSLSAKILIGLIFGVVVGLILGEASLPFIKTWIAPIGTLFINLIKMIIVPLVFASLIVGAASVGDVKKLGRMGVKTIGYYLLTTAFAVTLGLILGNLIDPGIGMAVPEGTVYTAGKAVPAVEVFLNLFPSNPLNSLVTGNMLQIIVFALFLGIGATIVGEKANPVITIVDGVAEITYAIVSIIMKLAPLGVFALITPVVAENGPAVLMPLLKVIIAVYLGCVLHATVVYSGTLVLLAGGFSPIRFFKGIMPAMVVAFTTCSSAATLPVSIKCTTENLGVSKEVASFVQPLGATINMDGTAIYQGVCALFVAQVYGLNLNFGQQATVVLTATLASIGTAGVPGAGLIMLTMVLQSINLPLEAVALVAGIDRILDMIRTTVNITGDAACAVIVDHTEAKRAAKEARTISA